MPGLEYLVKSGWSESVHSVHLGPRWRGRDPFRKTETVPAARKGQSAEPTPDIQQVLMQLVLLLGLDDFHGLDAGLEKKPLEVFQGRILAMD